MAKLKPTRPIDFLILFVTLTLIAFGLIMVMSAGAVSGFNTEQNTFFFVFKQVKWVLLGSLAAIIAMMIPYVFWRRFAGLAILVSLGLLIMIVFTDAGDAVSGSARWINIVGVNVQPSEIAKLSLVLFFAHILDRYPIQRGKNWLTPLAILLPVTIIILGLVYKQPDLGTTLVLAATVVVMLLQTELPTFWFIAVCPTLGLSLFYLIYRTRFQAVHYQWDRLMAWLDPWKYASDIGYQMTNAQIAFGTGGLFGVGLGRSMQKYGFLPANHTDMIFAIVGEELGLVGCLFLLFLLVLLYARIFQVTGECPDRFGRLLGFGLAASLAIQTIVNLCVVTGVLPVTGITLPLISYGGSSLVITMVEIGIILNISRYRKKARLHSDRVSTASPNAPA